MKWIYTMFAVLLAVAFCQVCYAKPNILVIIADDLGWNDVGYHNSEINTPYIDQLASDGVKLENYYVQPTCSPSRSALLTGRYSINTGFYGGTILSKAGIPLTETLLPQSLSQLGYSNHHIGKWHIGYYNESYLPLNRGYHSFFGFHTGAMNYYTKIKCSVLTKNSASERLCGYDLWQNTHVYKGNDSAVYSTHLFTKRAIDTIRLHASHPESPFFITLAYQAVHSPVQAPRQCISLNQHIKNYRRRHYAGMVSCLDQGIGNITKTLKDTGLWNNTVVIFTTDNGGQTKIAGSNWPLRGEKNTLFEGGIRAVGFVSSPLINSKGAVNNNLYHIMDWYPTIIKLAGGIIPTNLDGLDIWSSISENCPMAREELLLHFNPRKKALRGTSKATRFSAALRQGDWKLIYGNPGYPAISGWTAPPGTNHSSISISKPHSKSIWLFNVNDDPEEKIDLVYSHASIAKLMLRKIRNYHKQAKKPQKSTHTMQADPERHGGVWGPWSWTNPQIDYQQVITASKYQDSGMTTLNSQSHQGKSQATDLWQRLQLFFG